MAYENLWNRRGRTYEHCSCVSYAKDKREEGNRKAIILFRCYGLCFLLTLFVCISSGLKKAFIDLPHIHGTALCPLALVVAIHCSPVVAVGVNAVP